MHNKQSRQRLASAELQNFTQRERERATQTLFTRPKCTHLTLSSLHSTLMIALTLSCVLGEDCDWPTVSTTMAGSAVSV